MSRVALAALVTSAALFACDTQSEEFSFISQTASVPVTEVVVELDSGRVQATGTYDAGGAPALQVKATALAQWYGERPTVEFIQNGTSVRIVGLCGRHDTCEIDLAIEMPPGATLRVDGDVTDVAVESVHGPTTIETATGDLDLTKVGGPLDLSTREGAIMGRGITADIVEAQTYAGPIGLEFSDPLRSVRADTVKGDIRLTVPPTGYVVEATTGDGTVDILVQQVSFMRKFIHAVAAEAGDIWIGPPESSAPN